MVQRVPIEQPESYGMCGLAYGAQAIGMAGPGPSPGGMVVPGMGAPQVMQSIHTPPCVGPKCQLWTAHRCCAVKLQADSAAQLSDNLARVVGLLANLVDRLQDAEHATGN